LTANEYRNIKLFGYAIIASLMILTASTLWSNYNHRDKASRDYVDGSISNIINLQSEYVALLKIYVISNIIVRDSLDRRMTKIEKEINRHYQEYHATRGSSKIDIFNDPMIEYRHYYTLRLMQIHY